MAVAALEVEDSLHENCLKSFSGECFLNVAVRAVDGETRPAERVQAAKRAINVVNK